MEISELLHKRKFDRTKEPEPEQVIFRIDNKKIGSLQNLVTITGRQKNGKTRYISAAIASALTRSDIFSIYIRTPPGRGRVCFFDTEQGDFDFYRTIKQIQDFSGGYLPENFDAYNTREDEPEATLKMIELYLKNNPDCSIMVIDGLLDLIIDFNNVAESKHLTNFLKRITKEYNCLIIAVIHRGKGSDTTIGNIGSMADRLAQSILKVEKNKEKNTFILSADFLRSDEDFTPVEIYYDGDNWAQTFHTQEPSKIHPMTKIKELKPRPEDIPLQEHKHKVYQIFREPTTRINYENLIKMIKEFYTSGRNWAVDCLKYLKENQIIFRDVDGYTINPQSKIFYNG